MGKKMAHYAHKHHNHAKQYFDLFTYIHSLRKVGVSQEVAEIQGEALKNMSEQIANQSQFLLTKADQQETNLRIIQIQTDVKEIRHELVLTRQELKADIVAVDQKLSANIASVEQRLSANIASVEQKFSANLASVEERLSANMVLLDQKLSANIDSVREELKLSISKYVNSTRLWMFSMMSLMLGVMARGFHWI